MSAKAAGVTVVAVDVGAEGDGGESGRDWLRLHEW
jgi:hypothetical protein